MLVKEIAQLKKKLQTSEMNQKMNVSKEIQSDQKQQLEESKQRMQATII